MKKISMFVLALIVALSASPVLAETNNPNWIKMDRYQVPSTGDVFLIEHNGWQFPSCPTARHAKIKKSSENFDEMFATVMMAYMNRVGVILHGDCDLPNAAGVIDSLTVTYILMKNELVD